MDEEYNEALKKFFGLKKKYEANFAKKRRAIYFSDKFTREEKKRRIQAIKQRCVSCGKPGKDNKNGTLFLNSEGKYIARCNVAEPCGLNLVIKKAHYMLIPKILEILNQDKFETIKQIITLKLSLLFGLESSEIVAKEFQNLKDSYRENAEAYTVNATILSDLDKITVDDDENFSSGCGSRKIEESAKIGEKTYTREKYVKLLTTRLQECLLDFEKIIKDYNNPPQDEKDPIVLKRALELYIDTLVPLQSKIMRGKYSYNAIENVPTSRGLEHHLVQQKHTIPQLEILLPGHEPEIISNKI